MRIRASCTCTCTVFGVDSLSNAPIAPEYVCVYFHDVFAQCSAWPSLRDAPIVRECLDVYVYKCTYCTWACVLLRVQISCLCGPGGVACCPCMQASGVVVKLHTLYGAYRCVVRKGVLVLVGLFIAYSF